MPANITETATKGTVLSVPIGTDKRKASSLTAAWQAIGNRLKFWEDWHTLANVLFAGGSLASVAQLTVDITGGGWKFTATIGTPSLEIDGASNALFKPNGRCGSELFTRGLSGGGANYKCYGPGIVTTGANLAVNPLAYDLFDINPSAAIDLQLLGTSFPSGHRIRVINRSHTSGRFISVKNNAGTLILALTVNTSATFDIPIWQDFYWDGTVWHHEAGNNPDIT